MGRSVNKVTLIGTLGRDPEVRYLPNGNAVANLSLATDESYNDRQTGQKVEATEWHRITVYGKLAEIVQQYLKKGSKAYFEGKLRTREWEKDGVKRYTTEIIANDMMMLDGRGQDAAMGAGNMGGYQQPGNAAAMMNPGYGQPAAPQAQPSGNYQQAPQGGNYQQPSYQQAPAPQATAQRPQAPAGQPSQQAPSQPMPNQGGYQQAPAPAQQPSNSFDDFDDDIPF